MTIKNRLAQLERRANERPVQRVEAVEIYGTREDGTRYLIETWPQLIGAGKMTDKNGAPVDVQYQRSIDTLNDALEEIVSNEQH